MTNEFLEYGMLFDEDAETPQFKLETIALRLSHVIAGAMDACGMTRTDLARSLGVSPPMVTKILSGHSNFTLKTLVGLADVLDYEFDPVFRPKDYSVAVDYVFPVAGARRPDTQPRATHSIRTDAIRALIGGSQPGELDWNLDVSSGPIEPPHLRAVA